MLSHVRIAGTPEDDPCRAHRRRRRAAAARLRPRRRGQRRGAVASCGRPHPRRRQHARDDHRRLHPQPRPGLSRAAICSAPSPPRPGRATPSSSTRRGSRPRCSAIRSRPTCSCSATPISRGWCRFRRAAIERAIELNGVAVEFNTQRLPLGPARRASTAPRSRRAAAPAKRRAESRRLSETLDEVDRAPRRVPDRLPERRLCRALSPTASRRSRAAEAATAPGSTGARRGGGARAVQADGLQGRVRGRAALHRDRISASRVAEQFEGDYALRIPSRAAAPRRARPGDRASAESAPTGRGC